jgi:hypothetical protein
MQSRNKLDQEERGLSLKGNAKLLICTRDPLLGQVQHLAKRFYSLLPTYSHLLLSPLL